MKSISLYHNSDYNIIESDSGKHLFTTNGSRLYDFPDNLLKTEDYEGLLSSIEKTLPDKKYIEPTHMTPPNLVALSLNIAQGCNLTCNYCYADEGKFKKHARLMDLDVALKSIDRLFLESDPESTITVGFMGGEPLLNRELMYSTTNYAFKKAEKRKQKIKFSITTNGTLLNNKDVEFFRSFPFTVTVSLDGTKKVHDSLRKSHNGKGSYDRIIEKLELFKLIGKPLHLFARSTVVPQNVNLLESLEHLINLDFDDVGFSPVLVSPTPSYQFSSSDFDNLLSEMINCGDRALEMLTNNEIYPFSNLLTAIHEIHRGSHKPYPCGAGAGYLSVNAEGNLFACHRLIDDEQFSMGDIYTGTSFENRSDLLANKFVDSIEPCKSCWARYLCGGGCYHEVKARGRIGCNFIRGWLTYCIAAYIKLQNHNPSYFNNTNKISHE